ncbi:MAG: N-acetylmuramoyl-L-alanine amidase [Paludibacteraceae bacterium]|nr:N-acetylmuramoyl-L-alanine amidase [Paludibacteraceae bacterium]
MTVVIDAGHGGKDPGAIGNSFLEKNINLKVALALGKKIKDNFSDVNVVYTRSNDTYVTLQDRAAIANRANGDLFISIHTNASESHNAVGTETFTLGLAKTKANFEVAKRENSVMLLENNKEVYQGFDPTSPDSYIMFELMQSTYMDLSIQMADYVQTEFTAKGRSDRGVRQAGFWVLHQVKMPSVLVELGFITNSSEEKFLGSTDGTANLTNCIYAAFIKFKHEYDKKTVSSEDMKKENDKKNSDNKKNADNKTDNKKSQDDTDKTVSQTTTGDTIYKVQCFAVPKQIDKSELDYRRAEKFGKVTFLKAGKYFKYSVGECHSIEEARELLKKVRAVFKTAFIVTIQPNNQ